MPTCLFELLALLLDLAKQPSILDREYRVGSERLQKLNSVFGKIAGLLAPDHERADDAIWIGKRHNEACTKSGLHCDLSDDAWRLLTDVRGLVGFFILGRLADRIGNPELLVPQRRN